MLAYIYYMIKEYNGEYVVVLGTNGDTAAVVSDEGKVLRVALVELYEVENENLGSVREAFWNLACDIHWDDNEAAIERYVSSVGWWKKKVANAGKTCTRCDKFKHLREYHAKLGTFDGLATICKGCKAEQSALAWKAKQEAKKEN
jgi:hypothetical protein